MASNVVPDNAFSRVEVVEYGHAVFVSFAVVRLGEAGSSSRSPVLVAALAPVADGSAIAVVPHELAACAGALSGRPVELDLASAPGQSPVDLLLLLRVGERNELQSELATLVGRLVPRVLSAAVPAVLPRQVEAAAAAAALDWERLRRTGAERRWEVGTRARSWMHMRDVRSWL